MPRRHCRDLAVDARARIRLDPDANRHPQTSHRRRLCLDRFSAWLCTYLDATIAIAQLSLPELCTALIGYGKQLFYDGEPKYVYAETINALVDLMPHLRGQLAGPWSTLARWEEAEPQKRSMIMPAAAFQAAVSLSLLWGWHRFAAALLIGFHGLLRPNEFLPLQRIDLILPRDLLSSERIAYIRIWHSKTSRFMLRQHARISDEVTVSFLDRLFGADDKSSLLFGCSPSIFRNRWDKVFKHLGICTIEKKQGITPKSLRGRGRWQARRTLEFYLQDVMGQVLLTNLSIHHQSLVRELAGASSVLLEESLTTSAHATR